MNFLKFFTGESEEQVNKYSSLYAILEKQFPKLEDRELLLASCIAGLLARVAYVDFQLDQNEKIKMKEVLGKFNFGENIDSEVVATMAIEHIKDMAGLENHLYVHQIKNLLTKDERFNIVQSLFLIAASDGSVEAVESEEIRVITKGLELSNQHFIAARAEVAKFLKSLNIS